MGGIASDRFHAHSNVFLALGLVLAGSSVVCEPWAHYLPLLSMLYFAEGTAQGAIDSGMYTCHTINQNVYCHQSWHMA